MHHHAIGAPVSELEDGGEETEPVGRPRRSTRDSEVAEEQGSEAQRFVNCSGRRPRSILACLPVVVQRHWQLQFLRRLRRQRCLNTASAASENSCAYAPVWRWTCWLHCSMQDGDTGASLYA
jgi:hypothetical protein